MQIELTHDRDGFAACVSPFLAARPERNVLATVLHNADWYAGADQPPTFAAGLDDDSGEVVAVALRTPPWHLIAAGFDDPRAAAELVERWHALDRDVPSIAAEPATARALADAWTATTGCAAELRLREAMHVLTDVTAPPRPAAGGLRLARDSDRDLVAGWFREFAIETGEGRPDDAERQAERDLGHGHLHVWEDEHRVVSMAGRRVVIAGTVRIGPVYTPPDRRNRGYATSMVAALSRQLLDTEADRCMLYTDLANPTSNKIYADVGYRRFADWELYELA